MPGKWFGRLIGKAIFGMGRYQNNREMKFHLILANVGQQALRPQSVRKTRDQLKWRRERNDGVRQLAEHTTIVSGLAFGTAIRLDSIRCECLSVIPWPQINQMNCLTQALADACSQNLLDEKWLIAPSRRVGQQWLESVTRSGQPIVNARIKTITSLAIDLAAEQMAANGVTLVSPSGGSFLLARILHRLPPASLAYFSQLESSAGFIDSIFETINDIRLADIDAAEIGSMRLEVAAKGQDLRTLLQAYSHELQANRLIDRAELLRMATVLLRRGPAPTILLLVPAGLETGFLEQELLRAFPESVRRILPVDEPTATNETVGSDRELLRWLKNPTEAPPPIGDGTVRIRRAVGEINEVRDVLRGCVAGDVRFDDVELLHTDSETYLPRIYETFCTLAREGETLGDDLPVTFAEGVPCRYSRPGRALAMWLAWIADDYPQPTLVQMLREGLLEVASFSDEGVSFSRLSGLLRGLGIGFGRGRYQTQLQDRIDSLQRQIGSPPDTADEDGELGVERVISLRRQLRTFQVLDALCTRLLACAHERLEPNGTSHGRQGVPQNIGPHRQPDRQLCGAQADRRHR